MKRYLIIAGAMLALSACAEKVTIQINPEPRIEASWRLHDIDISSDVIV